MKLILVNFNNTLGLNGSLNFLEGEPLLIYGENVAGKTNVINMLRYCLIPKLRERKGYVEEKRLNKNEILLEKNSTGRVEIYFQQNGKLYKLYYFFSRKGKNVSQIQKLFESRGIQLPIDDEKRAEVLANLEWVDLDASSARLFKEKLTEIGIYPEILDILISPSNVRNFSEAINGSVVRVPEIIATRISSIHENTGKYLENLKKLYGVVILERDKHDRKLKELKKGFEEVSEKLPEIIVDRVFIVGEITKNLDNLQKSIAKKLESIPSKVSEMKDVLSLLSSEKYEIWMGAIDQLVTALLKKEKLTSLIEKKGSFNRMKETLKNWKIIFEGLPPDSSPEGLLTFSLPDYKKFNFNIFSNPERIKSIFLTVNNARNSFQNVNETCRKYKISSETSRINEMIKSYKELLNALKTPLEPKGDPALLSERGNKVIVSIPLDIALKKIGYLRGIEPTPLIHRPEKLGKKEFEKKITSFRTNIDIIQSELRKAKEELSQAKKLLKKAKGLRGDIDHEAEVLRKNIETLESDLTNQAGDVANAYYHLCEVFKLKREKIDLSSGDAVDVSFKIISKIYEDVQKIFSMDLIQQLKNYPEILEKYKVSEEKDFASIVKKVREEFENRIKEASKLQEEYKKVNEWILTNIIQLSSIENKSKTLAILSVALLIMQAILSKIYEKTDIKRIIEELAEKIEENVKDIYGRIFPEDESFSFKHSDKGQFLSTINNEPITHPSGSQRAAISVGIMLSLAHTFGLPMILDEAFDRIDVKRLKFFCECITGLASSPTCYQICLAAYTSFNIEKNPEVLPLINTWQTYVVERMQFSEKNITPLKGFSLVD